MRHIWWVLLVASVDGDVVGIFFRGFVGFLKINRGIAYERLTVENLQGFWLSFSHKLFQAVLSWCQQVRLLSRLAAIAMLRTVLFNSRTDVLICTINAKIRACRSHKRKANSGILQIPSWLFRLTATELKRSVVVTLSISNFDISSFSQSVERPKKRAHLDWLAGNLPSSNFSFDRKRHATKWF